jgi:hypothetical protein
VLLLLLPLRGVLLLVLLLRVAPAASGLLVLHTPLQGCLAWAAAAATTHCNSIDRAAQTAVREQQQQPKS